MHAARQSKSRAGGTWNDSSQSHRHAPVPEYIASSDSEMTFLVDADADTSGRYNER